MRSLYQHRIAHPLVHILTVRFLSGEDDTRLPNRSIFYRFCYDRFHVHEVFVVDPQEEVALTLGQLVLLDVNGYPLPELGDMIRLPRER